MKKDITGDIIKIIEFILVLTIACVSAFNSLLINSSELTPETNPFYTPFYTVLWIAFVVIILLYPFLKSSKNKISITKMLYHFSLAFLIISAIICFFTNRNTKVEIRENETIYLSDVYGKMIKKYIPVDDKMTITLNKFLWSDVNKKNNEIFRDYISEVSVTNGAMAYKYRIKINMPLKLQYKGSTIKIYQNSWKFGVKDFTYRLYDKTNEFPENLYLTVDSNIINISPIGVIIDDNTSELKIKYQWEIYSPKVNNVIEKGYFMSQDNTKNSTLYDKYKFSIVNEDFYVSSVLEFTYKPYYNLLRISVGFFVLFLFINLFSGNLFGRRKNADID